MTNIETTRADHLAWCKARALEYVDAGDNEQAFTSMASDLGKHPGTAGHVRIELGARQLLCGLLRGRLAMRAFIEDFN